MDFESVKSVIHPDPLLVSIDPHLSIEEIALTQEISSGSVHIILHDVLERFKRVGYQK